MKIRTRLTLWYAVILFGSTVILTGLGYKHFVDERKDSQRPTDFVEFVKREMEDWDDVVSMVV